MATKTLYRAFITFKCNPTRHEFSGLKSLEIKKVPGSITEMSWEFDDPKQGILFIDVSEIVCIETSGYEVPLY